MSMSNSLPTTSLIPIDIVPKVELFEMQSDMDDTSEAPEFTTSTIKEEDIEIIENCNEDENDRSVSNVEVVPKLKKKNVKIKDADSEAIHCDVCDKIFRNNVTFGLHTIRHNNDRKYHCHMCKYKTISKVKFTSHIKVHEGKAGFKCEMCEKYFTSSVLATEHKYFHTGEKPFHCNICGKSFMFSKFLSAHQKNQHLVETTGLPAIIYECVPCNKQYTCISGLKRHQQRHHNDTFDPSRLCDICGKRIASEDKLKFHRRIHTGYKPFVCGICAKSFTRKDWLKEHERVHTGERPFICTYCGKGFTQRSPLRIHVRTHTGEKPYVCRICNKGFTSKGTMDVHMRKCEGI